MVLNTRLSHFSSNVSLNIHDKYSSIRFKQCEWQRKILGQRPHYFRWRKLGCGFKSPRGNFRFFLSFIVFLPFGFLLFILTADPFSFARFLRKRISSIVNASYSVYSQHQTTFQMPRVSHILDPVNITDSTHLHDIKKRKTYVVVTPTFSIIQRNL